MNKIEDKRVASKVAVEELYSLLWQIQKLHGQVDIGDANVLCENKHKLHKLLSHMNVDSQQNPFHNVLKRNYRIRRELTP